MTFGPIELYRVMLDIVVLHFVCYRTLRQLDAVLFRRAHNAFILGIQSMLFAIYVVGHAIFNLVTLYGIIVP